MSVDLTRLQDLSTRLDPIINAISAKRVSASNAVLAITNMQGVTSAVRAVSPSVPITDDWLQLLVDAAVQDLGPYVQQLEKIVGMAGAPVVPTAAVAGTKLA